MGAAAAKQLHSEKAKHAAAVLNAVQSFDENHGEDVDINNDPELFKRRVLLAAAEAKRNGNDIENSLAQLSDADFVSLCQYVGNQKDEENFANKSLSMKIEEINDEENNAAADNIDETTSVLSYGDDEEVPENESEADESGFVRVGLPKNTTHHISSLISMSKDEHDLSSGDEIDEHADSDSILQPRLRANSAARRGSTNGVRVFPIVDSKVNLTSTPVKSSRGSTRSRERLHSASERIALEEKLMIEDDESPRPLKVSSSSSVQTSSRQQQRQHSANSKHSRQSPVAACHSPLGLILPPSMAEKYSRIWEPDPSDMMLTASSSMAFDSPVVSSQSTVPASVGIHRYKFNTPSGGTASRPVIYKDLGERIDEQNNALMGLQHQKILSFTQNAQLEREVEALQRQLEKMDQLDGIDKKATTSSSVSSTTSSPSYRPSVYQPRIMSYNADIYPIDEESHSLRNQRGVASGDSDVKRVRNVSSLVSDSKLSNNAANPASNRRHIRNGGGSGRHHKHGSSSSSDTDNSSSIQSIQRYYAADGTGLSSAQEKNGKILSEQQSKRNRDGKEVSEEHGNHNNNHSALAPAHVSSIGGLSKPKQHVAPTRRRVRTGMSGSGLHASGNSSGFDSDDSANNNSNNARVHMKGNSSGNGTNANEWHLKDVHSHSNDAHARINNGDSLDHSGEVSKSGNIQQNNNKQSRHKRTPSSLVPENQYSFKQQLLPSEDESESGGYVKKNVRSDTRYRRMTTEETGTTKVTNISNRIPIDEVSPALNHKYGRADGAHTKLNARRYSMDGSGEDHAHAAVKYEENSAASQDEDSKVPRAGQPENSGPSAVGNIVLANRLNLQNKSGPKRRISGESKEETSSTSAVNNNRIIINKEITPSKGVDVLESAVLKTTPSTDSPSQVVAGGVARDRRRRERGPSLTSSKQQQPTEPVAQHVSVSDTPSLWTTQLDNSWAEVSLLLRKPIKSEADLQYTVAAAEAGILFIEQMDSISKTIQVLRGALSRWLLPFDNNTRIDIQCSTPHSVVENMPNEFRGKLTERQVHYLVAGANGVRQLVRIKIADDNDLEQARTALVTTDKFFKLLYHVAAGANTTPFQILQSNC